MTRLTLDIQVHATLPVADEDTAAQQFVLALKARAIREALTAIEEVGFVLDVNVIETGLHFVESRTVQRVRA